MSLSVENGHAEAIRNPRVVMHREDGSWMHFDNPVDIIATHSVDRVVPLLHQIEKAVARGFFAAGFIGYEASPAFDLSLSAHPADALPLIWFGLFKKPHIARALSSVPPTAHDPVVWQPTISANSYVNAINKIKDYIAEGVTYQVNFTYRLKTVWNEDPWPYFKTLCAVHPMPYAAYIDTGRYAVCSFSPELFFRLDGTRLITQPMKGTAARGRYNDEDCQIAAWLQQSEKERAENVMIVDMLRNDIGKVAKNGTVVVSDLFTVKKFRTLFQMVSTVEGVVAASWVEILLALFPCASITGAPKIRTTQIIRELETTPRHVYCGTVGWFGPHRQACFNVAIRTVLIDRTEGVAEFGTGGGIVWGSTAANEFRECRIKATMVTTPQHEFSLIETLLWRAGSGFFLLDAHLDRLMGSARYFGFAGDRERVLEYLKTCLRPEHAAGDARVRITVDRVGQISSSITSLANYASRENLTVTLSLATVPVDANNPFLFHKTTERSHFLEALGEVRRSDDLIFYNERQEITETSIGNIVVELDGQLVTPLVTCGLLPGVFRASLLKDGVIKEALLKVGDLKEATRIFRINSVRTWQCCARI